MTGAIAYQGARGAFGEEAAIRYAPQRERIARPTFSSVVDAVASGDAEIGVIPERNSTAGAVPDVAALLAAPGIIVVDRITLPIRIHLMAAPGVRLDDVKSVISHPMALRQCRRLIRDMALAEMAAPNTAIAARDVATNRDPHVAVIASEVAAEAHGLTILRRDVQDEADNATTFCVIGAAR